MQTNYDLNTMEAERTSNPAWDSEISINFGSEVGVSLDELGQEYQDMIETFELQKSRLHDYDPQVEPIVEESNSLLQVRSDSPTPSESSGKSPKKSGIKGVLASAGKQLKRRLSNKGPSTGQRKSPFMRRKEKTSTSSQEKWESGSLERDHDNGDVFDQDKDKRRVRSDDENSNNSTQQQRQQKHGDLEALLPAVGRNRLTTSISKETCCIALPTKTTGGKPPISPGIASEQRRRITSDEHVLSPPVLVNGELKSEFQYLSPSRRINYQSATVDRHHKGHRRMRRSNSFAKTTSKTENGGKSHLKKPRRKNPRESPLKALYDATVVNGQGKPFYADINEAFSATRRSST